MWLKIMAKAFHVNKVILLVLVLFLPLPALSSKILLDRFFPDTEGSELAKAPKPYDKGDFSSGCAEYDDGYSWAESNQPKKEEECSQGSGDFNQGCYDWFGDNR